MTEELIGKVSHWFGKIGVAGIELLGTLAVGDRSTSWGIRRTLNRTLIHANYAPGRERGWPRRQRGTRGQVPSAARR
jgi:hypothetical protein